MLGTPAELLSRAAKAMQHALSMEGANGHPDLPNVIGMFASQAAVTETWVVM